MARQKPSDQVATLRKQQAELTEKLHEAEAKAEAEAKELHRRKCEIVGAVALKEAELNPTGAVATTLRELLHTGITKAADRALFDLAPLPKATKPAAE